MRKIILLILFIIILSSNFSGQNEGLQNKALSEEKISAEEYKLWSDDLCLKGSKQLIVITNETLSKNISLSKETEIIRQVKNYYAERKLTDVTKDLVNDFNLKNSRSYSIERKLPACENYILINKTEIENIFTQSKNLDENWKEFRVKYPTAWNLNSIARIGFSPDKNQAIMYYSYGCGSTCGAGYYIFFVKKNDMWIEEIEVNVWNS